MPIKMSSLGGAATILRNGSNSYKLLTAKQENQGFGHSGENRHPKFKPLQRTIEPIEITQMLQNHSNRTKNIYDSLKIKRMPSEDKEAIANDMCFHRRNINYAIDYEDK
jgi:hypothetical protein